jgi:hypothetical protein
MAYQVHNYITMVLQLWHCGALVSECIEYQVAFASVTVL